MNLFGIKVFERETIIEGDTAYMVRWRIVDCRLFGVYLHKILRSDQDRYVHDHPFSFVSIMLWGAYGEVLSRYVSTPWGGHAHDYTIIRDRRAPSICFRRAEDAHRLVLDKPCWTLVLRGPRRREWGFYTESKWVHFRDYLRGQTKDENRRKVEA